MSETDLALVQAWIKQWGYLGVVILMLLESAPLTGLLLPGIFITISLGGLTASGILRWEDAWLFASLGAVLGDSLGYWSGRLGSKKLHPHLHKTRFVGCHRNRHRPVHLVCSPGRTTPGRYRGHFGAAFLSLRPAGLFPQ